MKLIIHAGTSKTGSTSIQLLCHNNREALANYGVLFPRTGLKLSPDNRKNRSSGHYEFIQAAQNNDSILLNKLNDEISEFDSIDTVLISCENFSFINDIPEKLKSYFKSFENYKIIIYLRRQDYYLESLYKEFVSGGWRKLSVSIDKFFESHNTYIECDYYKLLTPWSEAFGKNNIIVRPFEKNQWVNQMLIADFFSCLNLSKFLETDIIFDTHDNISKTNEEIVLINLLNNIELKGEYYREALHTFFEVFNNNQEYDKSNKFLSAPKQRIYIIHKYSESNLKVAREYLNKDSLFFNLPPNESDDWSKLTISNLELFAKGIVSFMIAKNNETHDITKRYGIKLKEMKNDIHRLHESYSNIDTAINNLHSYISTIEGTTQNFIKQYKNKTDTTYKALSTITLDKYIKSRNSIWKAIIRKLRNPLLNEVKFLRNTKAVDKVYYYCHYPDAIKSGLTVEKNYASIGVLLGRNPSANFNTHEYILQNPEIVDSGMNPLVHSLLNNNL